MKKTIISSIFILLALFGCRKHHEGNVATIPIWSILQGQMKSYNLSNFVSNIELIPLETNNHNLIGKIYKVEADSNQYFIQDDQNILFSFNKEGKYNYCINNKGNGPNEYVEISDFIVLPSSKKIVIFDMYLRKLLIFNMDGAFIKEFKMDYSALNISFLNEETIVLYTPSELNKSQNKCDMLFYFNIESGKITRIINKFNASTGKSKYLIACNFNRLNDNLYVKIPFCDTIFQVLKDKLNPYYILDFSERGISRNIYSDINKFNQNRDFFIEWSEYYETNDYFLFTVQHDKMLKRAIINKKTKDFYLLNSEISKKTGFYYNNLKDITIWPQYCLDDYFLSFVNADEFVNSTSIINGKKISNNDNPVIIKGKFKKL